MKNNLEKFIFQTGHAKDLAKAELLAINAEIHDEVEDGFVVSIEIADPVNHLYHMGGIVRITKVLREGPALMPINFVEWVTDVLYEEFKDISGKLRYGLSMHPKSDKILKKILNDSKNALRGRIGNLRYVNKDYQNLSSVQAWHENLVQNSACELNLFKSASTWYLTKTLAIQDFEWYSHRDFNRPKKDAHNGMFPPKLAQILINLSKPTPSTTIFDPFCGSGTVLQEAILMDYKVMGSDIEAYQVLDAKKNLEWLFKTANLNIAPPLILQKDATKLEKEDLPRGDFTIVTESYLGPQLSREPSPEEIKKYQSEIEELYENFFSNLKKITDSLITIVFTAPYYRVKNDRIFLPNLQKILEKHCKIIPLSDQARPSIFYERKGQFVCREIWKVRV